MVRTLIREPLVHFFAIGLVLFGLNAVVAARGDDPRKIVVTSGTYERIATAFEQGHGRKPTADELKPLIDTWVSNEVMYREAKSMQLDQGDEMIRERVVQKVRVMIAGEIDVGHLDDDALRDWFEDHRDNYDRPAFYDFTFARVDGDEDEAKAVAAQWQGVDDVRAANPTRRILSFQVRPEENVVQLLGRSATQTLKRLAVGDWAPVEGPTGWGLVRLDHLEPPRPAVFEEVKADVRKRWTTWATQRQGAERIADMRRQYVVVYQDIDAGLLADGPQVADAAGPETRPDDS